MKRIFCALSMLVAFAFCSLNSSAAIIGDSAVHIFNNWVVNDSAVYEKISKKIKIQGSDTIIGANVTSTFSLKLKEMLPNGNLIFESKANIPSFEGVVPVESINKFIGNLSKILEKPQIIQTDSLGRILDIPYSESFRGSVDSCYANMLTLVDSIGGTPESKAELTNKLQNCLSQSLNSGAFTDAAKLFYYYGKGCDIGTFTDKTTVPIEFLNNAEIDAEVTFTCEILEKTDSTEVVSIRTSTIYNSEQLFDAMTKAFASVVDKDKLQLDHQKIKNISAEKSEEYIIDVFDGTVLLIEYEDRVTSPEGIQIKYTAIELAE